ncbi:hypothetical protein DEO72_LG6g584 [Vigna unguiculata]|uniref:Uncharacterized protein n=1 Tax=Vigna unguiculata TaxID=3917 RepID=A0A4D6M4Y3_VIGUN|nr:hypothetical protein DEO72_LG6g584 [Vigna unguiculata]
MQIHLQRTPITTLLPDTSLGTARRIVPDRLAVSLYRRAPPNQRPFLFVAYRLAEHVLPPGATPVETLFYWFRHFQGLSTTCNHSTLHANHPFQKHQNATNYAVPVHAAWRFPIAARRFITEPRNHQHWRCRLAEHSQSPSSF